MLRLLPCLSASPLRLPLCRAAVRARRPAASLLRYIRKRAQEAAAVPSVLPSCLLLPPAAAAAVLLSASPFGLLLYTPQIRTYLMSYAPRKTGRRGWWGSPRIRQRTAPLPYREIFYFFYFLFFFIWGYGGQFLIFGWFGGRRAHFRCGVDKLYISVASRRF